MKLDGLTDKGFGFCHGGAGGNTAWKIGNICRVVCRGFLNHNGVTRRFAMAI